MTDEELAKHWNVSLEEVKSISDFMNNNFVLHVGKKKDNGLYYGLVFREDPKHGPMLAMSSNQGFETPREAAVFLNEVCDRIEMPKLRAKLMDVPTDAYKALKKIDLSAYAPKTKNLNTVTTNTGRD